MSIDHAAVGRLIRYGLEPRLSPGRSADYAELVGRARSDSEFAAELIAIAGGQGLDVLDVDPILGLTLAATPDSPYAIRLEHYARRDSEDRLLHALVQLAIAGTAYPTAESLEDDRLRTVTIPEVVERVIHIARRLRDRLGSGDPPDDRLQLEPLYRFVLRMPVTGTTPDDRAHIGTLTAAVKRALRKLVDLGLADPVESAGPDAFRLRARYRIHVRDAANYIGDALEQIRQEGAR